MNTFHTDDPGRTRVSSLRDLPQDIAPSRDLWPAIESQIVAGRMGGAGSGRSRFHASRTRVLALAAVISALAVGVWLGRSVLPGAGNSQPAQLAASDSANMLPAAYVMGPRYVKEREALVASFESQVRALPPESREKVLASLAGIRKSMDDIRAALGREPGNALLQELLVNTCQDEMRVLTAVHEAGDVRKEI